MQMAAFFNDRQGVVIIANDPTAAIADWYITPGGKLVLKQFSESAKPFAVKIAPTLNAAAAAYREWAKNQFWSQRATTTKNKLDFMIVASSSSTAVESAHINDIRQYIKGPLGVWFTQWRRHPFDRNYPDYIAKQPREFAELLSVLKQQKCLSLPYMNSLLWDDQLDNFRSRGSRAAVRNTDNATQNYNQQLQSLIYACPGASEWRSALLAARNAILDADGERSNGIYLDMLAAAPPQLCWSDQHGHAPGDPLVWQNGLRELLRQVSGRVMVEGCAEIYMDLTDYFLMHLYTDQEDAVPLWYAVYGDAIQTMGWKLKAGITQPEFFSALSRASDFGVRAMASPWMTTEPEAQLLRRRLLSPPLPPNIN